MPDANTARNTQIQNRLQEKMATARWARCLKRLGWLSATLGFAIFKSYADLQEKFDGTVGEALFDLMPDTGTVKTLALALAIVGLILVILAYLLSDIRRWLSTGIRQLWPKYFKLRDLETVDMPRDALLKFIFEQGDARNPGSFIRLETLHWLATINPEYVCAWAEIVRTQAQPQYQRPCFYVVAPLSRAGREAMEKRIIKKNKDLLPEHVARSFSRACGLYIIEVYGGSFFEKGAILYLLQKMLDKKLTRKAFDPQFKIYTRPVNQYGYGQVKRFGFTNLGETPYEMHRWQAEATPGLCRRQAA